MALPTRMEKEVNMDANATNTAQQPAFSKVGVRPAGIALHSSNHAVALAFSAWK